MTYTPIPQGTPNWDVPVNAAFTDQDSRITTLESNQSQASVFVPEGWGQFWRPKRNASGGVASKVMVVGDSIAEGYYATDPRTDSWVGQMRTSLQDSYGDGGSGMFSTARTDVISGAPAPTIAVWEGNGQYATTTGTWTAGAQFFGPGISFIVSTAAATATFQVRGSTIKLYSIDGAAPRAAYTYSIDGGAPVTVNPIIGATTIRVVPVTGLSNGNHTVVISWAGAPTEPLNFIGVAGENSTGCIIDNLGKAGSNTTTSGWTANSALSQQWNGGPSNPADLLIYVLGANDAATSVTPDAYISNMALLMSNVRDGAFGQDAFGNTDIIIVQNHFGHFTNPLTFAQYGSRLHDLADTYGAAYVNIWSSGRNSWPYWNSLGFWGNASNPGPAGTDNVHPSNAGHTFMSSVITPLVMS